MVDAQASAGCGSSTPSIPADDLGERSLSAACSRLYAEGWNDCLRDLTTPRYITEWTEEDGNVLWWHYPIQEPPYVGTPLDTEFADNWHTWWTPLPSVDAVNQAFADKANIANAARAAAKGQESAESANGPQTTPQGGQ